MNFRKVSALHVASVLLGVIAVAATVESATPHNPTLTVKQFQASQLAAFFAVDADVARRWVPAGWPLALDAQGKATGVLAVMNYPEYCLLRTPNNPPLAEGVNVAPAAIAHFWFLLQGPPEVLPVPGAKVTTPTAYYYDVADLVTSREEHALYRRSGRAAILVSDITLLDEGQTQTGEITFHDGRRITFSAFTPVQLPAPVAVGGNVWQWHVGGAAPIGEDLGAWPQPPTGNASNVSVTRGQFVGLAPGPPNTTQVAIEADPGTIFEKCFGASAVVASRATFFRLNNIVLNWGRGELLWTIYPPTPIPVPPLLP